MITAEKGWFLRMADASFKSYRGADTPVRRAACKAAVEAKGYYAFYAFVEDFRELLKRYSDSGMDEIAGLIERGRTDFPDPGRFSPSWDRLWEDFENLCRAKNVVLAEVPVSAREGEWQVLIDNPLLPQQVVCYPGLPFEDAAYLYAYFQKDLKPNEFLRLQRVTHLLVKTGSKEASILPDA